MRDDEEAVFLGDIMEMWSFAAQVNNDGVMSSVAVVLALLLQVISNTLELVPHGLGICQTLLQERQLKSISRNLSSERSKGFIISPTLRLLREAVCLDGGAVAKRVFRARNFTFSFLGRNLEIGSSSDSQEDTRKTSVRTNAVRFFLSCLKYLHSEGRRELLSQRDLLSRLTFMVKSDPPYLVLEMFDVLKTHVLMDEKLPRDVKFRSFNIKTLMRILALYAYTNPAEEPHNGTSVSDAAHHFLIYVCTSPTAGILYSCSGLYPKELDGNTESQRMKTSFRNTAGEPWEAQYSEGIPVFNFVLSEFARKLRPWSSFKQSELLVSIFKAAPELVADYFINNRAFTFEPKLSMTWIGYAAFLFDTMNLPLPHAFGDRTRFARGPPPMSILVDNILPLPLNQKILVRCLSPSSHLTSFFAARILLAALEKLATAVSMHEKSLVSPKYSVWSEASRRLIDTFCQRIPDMKEIVRSYKGIPAENILHRAVTSRLLRTYYEVIPRVALAANFDVAPFFVDVLRKLHQNDADLQDKTVVATELANLVSIASHSPGMRWFSKVDNLRDGIACSPYVALLRLFFGSDEIASYDLLESVLMDVSVENQLVSPVSKLLPLRQALKLVTDEMTTEVMDSIWSFLDNCISRCATSPIKYLEFLHTLLEEKAINGLDCTISLLSVTMVEQLPYATAAKDHNKNKPLARFLELYLNALYVSHESKDILAVLHSKVRDHFSSISVEMAKLGGKVAKPFRHNDTQSNDQAPVVTHAEDRITVAENELEEALHVPFEKEEDATVLVRWLAKNVEDLVEDGWAAKLVHLLLSQHTNIRKEAFTNILKMAAKMKESSYEEKDQIWLLLSELAESSRAQVDQGPVPSAFVAFTVHALDILRNPLHPLYPKVNTFLTRGPAWSLEKLPLAHDILHGEPSEDDRYYTEIAWLLTYLLDGLRTPSDLGIFHRKRWFEKILALGSNPYLRSNLRTRILRLLYRTTCIDGGSTTLITRFGLISWLLAQRAACEVPEDAAWYEAMLKRAWNTCDQKRVNVWTKGSLTHTLIKFDVHLPSVQDLL